jgi:uncharacterized protein
MLQKQEVTPTSAKNRIAVLDVVRGFAIFSILLANIQSWSGSKFICFEIIMTLLHYNANSKIKHNFLKR